MDYILKITFDLNENFPSYRTVKVPGSMLFSDFNKVLTVLFGYVAFKTYDFILEKDKWLRPLVTIEDGSSLNPLFISENSLSDREQTIEMIAKIHTYFIWEYDISSEWDHIVEVEKAVPSSYPSIELLDWNGDNPDKSFISPSYFEDSILKGGKGIPFDSEKVKKQLSRIL